MSFEFNFNVAALFSPLLLAIVAWLINHAKTALMKHMDENRDKAHAIAEARHRDNIERFDRIEKQTTETNGKVANQEQRLTVQEAKTQLLTDLFLSKQPDRGE